MVMNASYQADISAYRTRPFVHKEAKVRTERKKRHYVFTPTKKPRHQENRQSPSLVLATFHPEFAHVSNEPSLSFFCAA